MRSPRVAHRSGPGTSRVGTFLTRLALIQICLLAAGWRMNTNNIRNMNTNTLCVGHLKYEYTQFLLFIFTNIIRSSTPQLATITALQKAAKSYRNTYLGLEPATFWSFVYRFAKSDIGCDSDATCLLPLSIAVIGRRPTTDQWSMLKQMQGSQSKSKSRKSLL